jgi:sugar phosphate isomerase/epimerase
MAPWRFLAKTSGRRSFDMPRPVTLFTGQWSDLPLTELARKCGDLGYDGLELACWGDHFDVKKALEGDDYCAKRRELLDKHNLQVFAVGAHRVGQAVLDKVDSRHQAMLPAYVWGDGDPAKVSARAAEELIATARAAQKVGAALVTGFSGSSIWPLVYPFPPVPAEMIDEGYALLAERFNPILDAFGNCGVKFALEVHPAQIAFDLHTAERTLEALDYREEIGFNLDPSHLMWQGVDPVEFIRAFPKRIYHVHMKDVAVTLNGHSGILGSHLPLGNPRRGWDFRTPGRGGVNFEEIIRALNAVGYAGPLSVELEDVGMDREHSIKEAQDFVRRLDFQPSRTVMDVAVQN